MSAQLNPPTYTDGKITYAGSDSHIVSKKQYVHPVEKEADIIRNTFQQTAYGINILGSAFTTIKLRPFARAHILDHYEGAFRNYVQQEYGRIFTVNMPEFPGVGQTIAPTAAHHLTIFQDQTGNEVIKRTAKVDHHVLKASQAFIDLSTYRSYVEAHAIQTGQAIANDINLISKMYFAAMAPGVTMTQDVNVVPFLDNTVKPDEAQSKAASEYFDTAKNDLGKIIKKEVIGQVQSKLTNVGYYSPELYTPYVDDFEISEPTKITVKDNDTDFKKIYFRKDSNKQKLHKDITRFSSLVALKQAILNKVEAMSTIDTPTNMAFYKPFESAAQNEYQMSRTVNPKYLELILNPYDKAEMQQKIGNTSPYGNYDTSLDAIEARGITIYTEDTVMPGHFILQESGIFRFVRIIQETYHLLFAHNMGQQFGAHLMGKIYINKFSCFYKGIPLHFVAAQEYYNHFYKALKVA